MLMMMIMKIMPIHLCIDVSIGFFGQGLGNIFITRLLCRGNEANLSSCESRNTTIECNHSRDAGIKCGGKRDCCVMLHKDSDLLMEVDMLEKKSV